MAREIEIERASAVELGGEVRTMDWGLVLVIQQGATTCYVEGGLPYEEVAELLREAAFAADQKALDG